MNKSIAASLLPFPDNTLLGNQMDFYSVCTVTGCINIVHMLNCISYPFFSASELEKAMCFAHFAPPIVDYPALDV